jgi:hypothetical protein
MDEWIACHGMKHTPPDRHVDSITMNSSEFNE